MASKELKDFLRLQLDLNLARQDFTAGLLWGKVLLDRAVVPDGAGRAVITLPGFGAPPASLARMNSFLRRHNYKIQSFDGGTPEGQTFHQYIESELCPALNQRVQRLADQTGAPVSLVGQSAGGLYAREFARRFSDDVDRVITLGTPTFHPNLKPHANAALAYIVRRTSGMDDHDMVGEEPLLHWRANEPQLPYVAIYSPIDGAVSEVEAAIPDDIVASASAASPRENVVVYCSHFGMTLNPLVLIAVADRLGQSRDQWAEFDGSQYLPRALQKSVGGLAYPSRRPAIAHPEKLPASPANTIGSTRAEAARIRVVNLLRQDHQNMVALMNTMAHTLKGNGKPDYQTVFDGLHYLSRHADAFHHTREDFLFERLRRRTARFDEPLMQLERDHEDLSKRADQLIERMRRLGNPQQIRRNGSLNQACRKYIAELTQHLLFEDQAVFGPALEKLKARDWIAIDAAIEYVDDPLFSRRIKSRYAQLNQTLGDAAETVSEEALFLSFLEFGAFLESAQAVGRGVVEINNLALRAAKNTLDHNVSALRNTLAARDWRSFLDSQVAAARGNVSVAGTFLAGIAKASKTAGREMFAPYRSKSGELIQDLKSRDKR